MTNFAVGFLDMIKGIILLTLLLAPCSAFGANPGTNLSVQVVPPNVVVGLSIGVLIGGLSGLMTYLMLSDAHKRPKPPRVGCGGYAEEDHA